MYMQELVEPLVDVHGLLLAEMLVADQVVAQEAAVRGIAVTDQDIADENTRSLRGLFGEQVKPDQRDRVLDELLRSRGLTRRIWDSTMRRNALLRKMVSSQVAVNDAMLKTEFARVYGEKVQVGHIQLPTLNEAQKVQALLKEGKEFGELARRYSTNSATAKDGGMLGTFTRDSVSLPQAMRDAAFAAREGEVTGVVNVGDSYHLLKVHKRYAPEKVDLEAVKEKLGQDLSDRITERLQADLLTDLRRKADVKYVNPSLFKQAQQARQQAAPPPGP
jgi:parvulin-like peptidyl-prolyl isomerase